MYQIVERPGWGWGQSSKIGPTVSMRDHEIRVGLGGMSHAVSVNGDTYPCHVVIYKQHSVFICAMDEKKN